jgi:hypothetical protein
VRTAAILGDFPPAVKILLPMPKGVQQALRSHLRGLRGR